MTTSLDEERLALWEERFPGKGAGLMKVVQPFYDWMPEIKPPLPNLEERARGAVFWHEFGAIRCIGAYDGAASISEDKLIEESLFGALCNEVDTALGDYLQDIVEESLGEYFTSLMREDMNIAFHELGTSLAVQPFIDALLFTCGKAVSKDIEQWWENMFGEDDYSASLLEVLVGALDTAFYFSLAFQYMNKFERVAQLRPFLELWLEGNFPVGFDSDGSLLILVAD